MKEKIPSKTRKRIEDGILNLEEAIHDSETRNTLESVIDSYSKIDRTSRIGKQTYLVESLANLCGRSGTELIVNLLSRGSSIGSLNVIDSIKNPETKAFLKRMIMKYGAQYQWFLEPFQKDWQRYNFSTKFFGVPPIPIVELKIINKSGQLYELESPLIAYIDLVVAQVQHLQKINEELEKMGNPQAVRKFIGKDKLIKIKEIVEKLLEEDVKKT